MSTRNPLLLAHLTPIELEERGIDTAILPIGATEYHGNHLPYSTDTRPTPKHPTPSARQLQMQMC